jgi:hypothetical protein
MILTKDVVEKFMKGKSESGFETFFFFLVNVKLHVLMEINPKA